MDWNITLILTLAIHKLLEFTTQTCRNLIRGKAQTIKMSSSYPLETDGPDSWGNGWSSKDDVKMSTVGSCYNYEITNLRKWPFGVGSLQKLCQLCSAASRKMLHLDRLYLAAERFKHANIFANRTKRSFYASPFLFRLTFISFLKIILHSFIYHLLKFWINLELELI